MHADTHGGKIKFTRSTPFIEMPSNKEWGPLFWTLLHGLAERLGNQVLETMAADEAREIVLLLRGVETVMPCEKCRAHYHDYRIKNPFDAFSVRRGSFLRQSVREWLYALHETVNQRNQLPSFPLEELTPTYKFVNLGDVWTALFKYLQTSVAAGHISGESLKSFRRHLSLLRATLGV